MALDPLNAIPANTQDATSQIKYGSNNQTIDIAELSSFPKIEAENNKESTEPEKPQASQRSVEDAIKRANNKMTKTHCEFSYNEDVNRVSITVYDNDTGDVIREIPPEESLKMLQKLWEIAGLMVDEKR